MEHTHASRYFSGSYVEARHKFLDAAIQRNAHTESFILPGHRGAVGEELAIDVARIGAVQASRLLILTSGTHGPEGFCGSGCQVATLKDRDLLERLDRSGVALLLVHAVNPHGFSHLQRGNQDNVDLNRNHVNFAAPLPVNDRYAAVDPLVLPVHWPPTAEDNRAMDAFLATHGLAAYHAALATGQYERPDGMFYGGRGPTWNNLTMRAILRRHAAGASHVGWIDAHTGLGPRGHAEKIYAGRKIDGDLQRARRWWGIDVVSPLEGQSESPGVSGALVSIAYDECPGVALGLVALEYGTLPFHDMLYHLRASQWLRRNPGAPAALQHAIRQQIRDAFYPDEDGWKGAVWGQARTALLQGLTGLACE